MSKYSLCLIVCLLPGICAAEASNSKEAESRNSPAVSSITTSKEKEKMAKEKACKENWQALDNVKSQMRQDSTEDLRKQERELYDIRWKLDC
jgi:hypothetical protein